ncbi:extracellular solute-binding protein [Kineococcus rhizosphaerae]|uniref:Carbohydrate ABC transporter substrate-binding protein (CUT1 family) n=1 Tax=Kineococcus rhizosphaerae TaxID=559628 RepID=A0A2T0R382_9ACTN|nr:extracellular solute-binding protein [Kineococcus rhizosphaerae]PRY14512.1 carbohydrate ABC transporter substrate-binding protein (CUT1 family) [Kineococcus rhizosphaerae]
MPVPRRAALAAAALLTVSLATGCGKPEITVLDTAAKVHLTFWTGQSDDAQSLLEELAGEFERQHPNVSIDLSPGASSTEELLQKLAASFAANDSPDISYTFGSWASQLERSGRTLDITDEVAEPDVHWEEFTQAARETARPTGRRTIGFPAVVDNISLFYNTTVFDRAGVAYPTPDWTWDDFRAAARELTDPANQTYGYAYSVSGSEETTWQLWPHLWQNGGEVLDGSGKRSAFASPAGVEALSFLRAMAVDDRSVYLDQTDTKFAQLFASDRVAMMTSGPWELSALKTAGTSYGVVQLPGTDGNHETVSGPDLWTLFDNHDVNRAYWATQFTRWLTSPEQDEKFNVAVGNLPLRSSEATSEAFLAQARELPGLDVMQANAANAKHSRPTVPGYNGLSEAVGDAVAHVLQGQGTPQAALQDAAQAADKALRQG